MNDRDEDIHSAESNNGQSSNNDQQQQQQNTLNKQLSLLKSLYCPNISKIHYFSSCRNADKMDILSFLSDSSSSSEQMMNAMVGNEEFWSLFQELFHLQSTFLTALLSNSSWKLKSQISEVVRQYLKLLLSLLSPMAVKYSDGAVATSTSSSSPTSTTASSSAEEKESYQKIQEIVRLLMEKRSVVDNSGVAMTAVYEEMILKMIQPTLSGEMSILLNDFL
jgi:hypothetical protein